MLETGQRDPRAPGDRRMYLYFNYSESGSLRWYVKVSRKGRRIGISEDYGTPAFDAAYEAALAALVLERLQIERPLARRSFRRPGRAVRLDPAPAHRAHREPATREWREAVRGADAQDHQGGNEGAHPVTGGQPVVGAARHDPLDDRRGPH